MKSDFTKGVKIWNLWDIMFHFTCLLWDLLNSSFMAVLQRHQEMFGSFGANINAHTQRHLRAFIYIKAIYSKQPFYSCVTQGKETPEMLGSEQVQDWGMAKQGWEGCKWTTLEEKRVMKGRWLGAPPSLHRNAWAGFAWLSQRPWPAWLTTKWVSPLAS